MPLNVENNGFEPFDSDLDALIRLQAILLQAAEGARGPELDREYRALRGALMGDPTYEAFIPSFVRRYRDLGSMWPAFKSFDPKWEPRRREVRNQFEPILAEAERFAFVDSLRVRDTAEAEIIRSPAYDSTAWTGASSPAEKVTAVRTLLPVAQAAVESLIAALEAPGHNGGPPLDETQDAIAALRQLHSALGALLTAADEGWLAKAYSDGLPAEAARYAKRAARTLKEDPLPYALSATILGILTACGFPTIGGYLADVALTMKRKRN